MIEKICPECGAAFVPRDGRRLYCSEKCARRRHRRQYRENKRVRNRKLKLSPRQKMKINLARRDALAPKPRTEIIYHGGVIIERRGFIPAGVGALRRVCC